MANEITKEEEYSGKVVNALAGLFNDKTANGIDRAELKEDGNLTRLAHAISNIAPTIILNELTGNKKTQLENNHIANILCFQYGELQRKAEESAPVEAEIPVED